MCTIYLTILLLIFYFDFENWPKLNLNVNVVSFIQKLNVLIKMQNDANLMTFFSQLAFN